MSSPEWTSILAATEQRPAVEVLSGSELDLVVERVLDAFIADPPPSWWWTALRVTSSTIHYEGADGHSWLLGRLGEGCEAVAVITNDRPMPEGAIRGDLVDLIGVINDSIGSEYFLTSPDVEWVIFDTHHNSLVVAGSLPPSLT